MRRNLPALRTLACGTLGAALALIGAGCSRTPQAIRIAAVGPLTGSSAPLWREQLDGARLAADQANAAGGVLGLKVELVELDDQADPQVAGPVAQKLSVDVSIVAVIGHPNSGSALIASDVYDQYHVPFVITSATNPKITRRNNRYTFRICPTDELQGPLAAEYAYNTLGKKSFVIVHDDTAYGEGVAQEFGRRVDSLGGALLALEEIKRGQKDFSDVLNKVKSLKPDVIYFGGLFFEAATFLKEAREMGIQSQFIAPDGAFDPGFISTAGPAAEGALLTFLAPPWDEVPSAAAFVKAYQARFGPVGGFSPYGYDAVNVVLAGIKKAGKVDRQALRDALADPSFQFEGVTGPITFDKNRQVKSGKFYFYRVEDGAFKLAEQSKGMN
jgi:branched-chain amino acid transport system substrate-binding protein